MTLKQKSEEDSCTATHRESSPPQESWEALRPEYTQCGQQSLQKDNRKVILRKVQGRTGDPWGGSGSN